MNDYERGYLECREEALRQIGERTNKLGIAEDYYLHGLWMARDILTALKSAAPQDTACIRSDQEEAVAESGNVSLRPAQSRSGIPAESALLMEEEIELIRACLDDGTYTKQEQKDFAALCDLALRGRCDSRDVVLEDVAKRLDERTRKRWGWDKHEDAQFVRSLKNADPQELRDSRNAEVLQAKIDALLKKLSLLTMHYRNLSETQT